MSSRALHPSLSPRAVQAAHIPFVRNITTASLTALLASFTLTGCNFTESGPTDNPHVSSSDDRFHEKSFSWDVPEATPALAKTAARATHFATPEALGEAIRGLDASLGDPVFTDSLWKPVDYACDELTLALWNVYGTVTLGDSVVLDESILKSRCTFVGGEASLGVAAAGDDGNLAKQNATYPALENEHRVYPYKMIGRSWDNFDLVVYKSTGSETQFKKHREKLFKTAWWDTEAVRLGVRAYLLNCGVSGSGTSAVRTCVSAGFRTGSVRNDDYVGERDFSAGLQIAYTPPSTFTAAPARLKVSDAVLGMHSADHAGIAFRATSSSGLTNATVVLQMPSLEYVTW